MEYTAVKNPVYANSDNTLITCDVRFDVFDDFIPFSASSADSEKHGQLIYEECKSGKWGAVGDYVAPATDWQAKAEAQRQSLLSVAGSTISLWQSELLLGSISDDDRASLVKWIACINALKALDFSHVIDEAGYNAIKWPVKPE